jgi:hypothetical protein
MGLLLHGTDGFRLDYSDRLPFYRSTKDHHVTPNSSIENDMLSDPIHTRDVAAGLAVIGSQVIPVTEEDFLSHSI